MSKKVRVVFNPDYYRAPEVFDGDDWFLDDGDIHIDRGNKRVATVSRGTWLYVELVESTENVASE